MTTLMKAGQWDPTMKTIVINQIPTPEPSPGQILVKIISASLCHSDLKALQIPSDKPWTLGHEGAGIVTKLHPSSEDKGFQLGDAIGFLYHVGSCHQCEGCKIHSSYCTKGCRIQGFTAPGFFAQYAVVDWQNAIHIPQSWDLKTSSVFFCAGLTAFHAVDSCQLKPGQWLGVVGVGGVGQLAIQYAKAMGFNVFAVDINDMTLQTATALGAPETANSRGSTDEFVAKIRAATGGGVHAAAVFTGAKTAYRDAVRILRVSGLLMVIGIMEDPLEISTMDLAMGKYRVAGQNVGMPLGMKRALKFTTKHSIAPEVEFKRLEDLGEMVNKMQDGTATKRMVVDPWA